MSSKSITTGIAAETLFVSTAVVNHAEKKIKRQTMYSITYLPIHAEKENL
jgi:hypothetical protein